MAAPPAGGAVAPAAGPCGAAAASTSPPALEVTGLPPSLSGHELAVLLAHLRSAGKVITAFAQPGGSGCGEEGGGGAALVLLPPDTPAATVTHLAAGGLLEGCQMDAGMLHVSLCSDPVGWVQRAVGAELPASDSAEQMPDAAAPQQPLPQESPAEQLSGSASLAVAGSCSAGPACGGSSGGEAAGSAEAAGTGTHDCPTPSSSTPSRASSGSLPALSLHGTSGIGGSGGGIQLPRSGGSSASLAASGDVAEPGAAAGNSCLVVHNLSPYVMAWQVEEFFSQFGDIIECTKRPGATLAFVHFAAAAAAARAKEAVHYKVVPHLGQREAISIQYRKQQPDRSRSSIAPLASRSSSCGLPPLSDCIRGGSRGGGSECGGSDSGGSDSGGSRGGSVGGSDAGQPPALPATPQYMSGGRALVVKNLPLSLPYEAVRVFFSQFGKLTSCYKQTQAPFAFVTYSQPEAAAGALRAVNGMLCPDLNMANLIRVEYRRGMSARHPSSSSSSGAGASAGASTHADHGSAQPAQPGSSDGSDLSSRSESVHSENAAFNECCENSVRACRGRSGGAAPLAYRSNSGSLDCLPYPYPAPTYAVAFAYPCYLAPI